MANVPLPFRCKDASGSGDEDGASAHRIQDSTLFSATMSRLCVVANVEAGEFLEDI
jgi:hypothetical protein